MFSHRGYRYDGVINGPASIQIQTSEARVAAKLGTLQNQRKELIEPVKIGEVVFLLTCVGRSLPQQISSRGNTNSPTASTETTVHGESKHY